MAGNHESKCSLTNHCAHVFELQSKIKLLEERILKLTTPVNSKPCPRCGSGLVVLTTKNLKICDCGWKEEHKLKPGQKSILVEGLVGE